ncbi:MAG: stress response translation initiation inhibitor YciH [Candidatus Woesearchaeota archaeon]
MDDELLDKFGLPKELNVGDMIAKQDQQITVSKIKKKFGKPYTVIEGIDGKDIDIKDIAKKLKAKFACGGTFKSNMIELQGDHVAKIKDALVVIGFDAQSIIIKG